MSVIPVGAIGNEQLGLEMDPADLSFQQALDLLVDDPKYKEARAFYDGDHWQGGDAWVGPRLDENQEESAAVMAEIEETLVSHPAVEEVTDRHRDGVTSEPTWTIVPRRRMEPGEEPNTGESDLINEAEELLTNWWDEHDVLGEFQESIVDYCLGGRGLMRLFIPAGELRTRDDGTAFVPRGDMEQSIDRIWATHARAQTCEVFRDPISMRKVGVFVYEVVDIITGVPTQFAEITYVDDQGRTVVRVVSFTSGAVLGRQVIQETEAASQPLELNKRLTMFKMESKRLITEPILSHQKLLNMDLTMMGKNVIQGGFLERVILNGQPPGDWEVDEDAPGGKRFVPGRYKTGANTTNWIEGTVIGYDKDTKEPIIATPSVTYKDPVSPDTFTKTQDSTYKNILQGARQLHVIISGDAIASGESRKQARDDFEKSLKRTKTRFDAAGKWSLETALAWAAILSGKPGRYDKIRIDFDSQVDAGPISAEDRNSMQAEVTSGLRSRQNYIRAARVSKDPQAEERQIARDQSEMNPLGQVQLERQRLALAVDRRSNNLPPGPNDPLSGQRTPPTEPGVPGGQPGAVN
jgi:hypothetical protein